MVIVRIPWNTLLFVLLTVFFDGLDTSIGGQNTPVTHGSTIELPSSTPVGSTATSQSAETRNLQSTENPHDMCPSGVDCHKLGGACIKCNFSTCEYGKISTAECVAVENITCNGERTFQRQYHCRYCYQLDPLLYKCNASACPINTPRKTWPARPFYTALCTAKDEILCLGSRRFYRQQDCNWTSGYKWSTALILSITLGGFGADRFYLGLWREGIGKLFSFGGLGVWTLVDVILIAVGYVGPADGSLYI
ncbi:TM2 domain-containing protein 3-like [Haliotis cracherodii]|uniref:TM2 domain-containing protein 3-like n=1 Tax=Haliotis cracherodii TaxID=6455 RepID=UPI0039EADA1A